MLNFFKNIFTRGEELILTDTNILESYFDEKYIANIVVDYMDGNKKKVMKELVETFKERNISYLNENFPITIGEVEFVSLVFYCRNLNDDIKPKVVKMKCYFPNNHEGIFDDILPAVSDFGSYADNNSGYFKEFDCIQILRL